MSLPRIKMKALVKLPATFNATGGFGVSKSGGVWTLEPEWEDLDLISTVADPTLAQFWIRDTTTGVYYRMNLSTFGESLFESSSGSSVAIGTGSKTFTVDTNKHFDPGGFVLITSDAAPSTNYMFGQVTDYTTSTLTVNVTHTGGSGTYADWTVRYAGPAGATGTTGATGATGAAAGLAFAFATSTSMADPSAGNVRFNNATIASVTAIAISSTSTAAGNPSVSAWLNTFDDSTTTAHRGYLIIQKDSARQNFAIFDITGALTDNTTWKQLAVTHIASNGSFSAADAITVSFIRTGDKGADGAGTGDVTAATTFNVDNRLIRADGTGKGVQSAGIVVDDSDNMNGVVSLQRSGGVAVQGTNTNDNASASYVGEYVSSTVASGSAVGLSTSTTANITSISLTAGDWDIRTNIIMNPAGSTTTTFIEGGWNTTSATLPTRGLGRSAFDNRGSSAGVVLGLNTGSSRLSINATTTVYLVIQAGFGVSTMSAYGIIEARRVR